MRYDHSCVLAGAIGGGVFQGCLPLSALLLRLCEAEQLTSSWPAVLLDAQPSLAREYVLVRLRVLPVDRLLPLAVLRHLIHPHLLAH
eukprot:CAMPEP_0195599906 /NCGR_PEP_ID=MMETSP0815-20121206/4276_1 /TAXON_ID=97485 /ORGANISM="Prymnesium parvum, Strain Texoma1" /LENGTH=86 /DNA_ID=CAMNT_0040739361 /DNA_START=618 /DNA_END=875 /DNA_ORIENTATION=+